MPGGWSRSASCWPIILAAATTGSGRSKYLEMAGHKAQAEYANETAVRHYTDLLALLDETDETWQQRFDLLARRQQVYGLTGQPEAREADLAAMLALAEAHGDEMRRSDALNELADLYQWTGRYDEAVETADLALGLKTGLGDSQGQAQALHQLGVVRYYRGDYAQALPLLQRAVALRQELQDAKGEAWSAHVPGHDPLFPGRLWPGGPFSRPRPGDGPGAPGLVPGGHPPDQPGPRRSAPGRVRARPWPSSRNRWR